MTQNSTIRRLPSGSIDIDSYRSSITAQRGQANKDRTSLRMGGVSIAMTAGAIGLAIVLGSLSPSSNIVAHAPAVVAATR